jgi:DNA-binding transcriptional ArsR family regulator
MPEITIGAVSQHLARLRDAGILLVRAEGRRRWYRADAARLEELRRSLDTMWVAGLDRLASLASDTSPGEPDAAGRRRGGG